MNQNPKPERDKEQQAKREIVKKPNPHDVHEQREHGQREEGVVKKPTPAPSPADPRR